MKLRDMKLSTIMRIKIMDKYDYTIEVARMKSGMTQKQFAEYFDLTIRQVQSWEQGWRKIPNYLRKLMIYKLDKEGLI